VTLFEAGSFKLHSGGESMWRINLEALEDSELKVLAALGRRIVGPFSDVEGIPRGGLRLAEAMVEWIDLEPPAGQGPLLIVDDVLTTGRSIEGAWAAARAARPGIAVKGLVAFARGPLPPWVRAIFIGVPDLPP
jgi:hypothetical protein